jgi:hypothetical protein
LLAPQAEAREHLQDGGGREVIPNDMEIEVLRILNGENVPGWTAGAAMWSCAAALVGMGLAEGTYRITQAGKDFLSTHREQSNG